MASLLCTACKEGTSTSTCTTQLDDAVPYECKGCSDPGVVVGSDNGRLPGSKTMSSGAITNAQAGYILPPDYRLA